MEPIDVEVDGVMQRSGVHIRRCRWPLVPSATARSTAMRMVEAKPEGAMVCCLRVQVLGRVWLCWDVRQPVQDAHAGAVTLALCPHVHIM